MDTSQARVIDLIHTSPEMDEAYDVFARDIPPDFLEDRERLRNRLRVRDEGPRHDGERHFVPEGYTFHLLAAKQADAVGGAVCGHLISRITAANRAIGFVTYIAVLPEARRSGIGSLLMRELTTRLERESRRMTGKPLVGMVYEIEAEGKVEIKAYLKKLCGAPLDIVYFQPALHDATAAEPMQLWFRPLDPPAASIEELRSRTYPAEFVVSMVRNLFTMEYIGPQGTGFNPQSLPMTAFLDSIGRRTHIGFVLDSA